MMNEPGFTRESSGLCADGVALESVATENGTPTFVYSASLIDQACETIKESVPSDTVIAYAVKANHNLSLLKRLGNHGIGADIVSGGELARALKAGISPERIVFSGVGKTTDEIDSALSAGIRAIHVESIAELAAVEEVASQRGVTAPVTLRVNPDIDAETHPYIATGLTDTKFGLELEVARSALPRLLSSQHLTLEGVACHVGSQIMTTSPIKEAVHRLATFADECMKRGAKLKTLDAGGGFPIAYGDETKPVPSWKSFGDAMVEGMRLGLGDRADAMKLIIEPGRALVGQAGALLTRVLYTKDQGDKRFVIVDAAMTELIRPALYGAYHLIEKVDNSRGVHEVVDVVGPVCESADFIAKDRLLPKVTEGDLLAIHDAGAYGMSMASAYNSRPLPAEVWLEGGRAQLIRRRQKTEDLWRDEVDL